MTEQQVNQLLSRYSRGEATADEVKLLENWYLAVSRTQKLDAKEADFGGLKKEIWLGTLKRAGLDDEFEVDRIPERQPLTRTLSMPAIWKIAAAVAVMTLGMWLYYFSNTSRHAEFSSASPLANDIAPGKSKATIAFDNGETVDLNEEELDISSATVEPLKEGSEVAPEKTQFLASRIAKSKMVVLSTPRGGTYQVVLPDGTKVWLNADSKISFPSQFSGPERKVLLTRGEAYFEVSKLTRSSSDVNRNSSRVSFIVESAGQRVEVLGTHFNINSYADEGSIKTTLLEGSVNVNGKILMPNQQASLKGKTIQVKEVNPSAAIAWKNGRFVFEEERLEEIMAKVSRWYNVDVSYEDGAAKDYTYGGTMSRFDNVSKVLRKLEATGDVRFEISGEGEGHHIKVYSKNH